MRHVRQLKSKLLGRTPTSSREGSSHSPQEPAHASSRTTKESASEKPKAEKLGLFEISREDTPGPLSTPENYCVDVIAIHGLNGDAYSTWRHQPDGTLWLRDLLPKSLPGCRVYTYGYPSKVFSESMARLQECARDLLVSLRQLRDASVGVSHSDALYSQASLIAEVEKAAPHLRMPQPGRDTL